MLEKVTLGAHYFRIAILLRESIFLNGILTNAEVWYGVSTTQVSQLEAVDRLLLRKILGTPLSTPVEGIQLELGVLSINTIIKARRINYLHNLLKSGENEMIVKFFLAQWYQPVKLDWTEQVKQDLSDFKINLSFEEMKAKSKMAFKKYVKTKALEYEFSRLMGVKQSHSKMDNLSYSKLEIQEYFKLENMSTNGAKTLFQYRTRMAKYGENFRGPDGPIICPLCGGHLDNQVMGFDNCKVLRDNINMEGRYQDIFTKYIPAKLVNTLLNIDKFREEKC